MFKIYDAARLLNLNHSTIYRTLSKGELTSKCKLVQVINGCKYVTDDGMQFLKNKFQLLEEADTFSNNLLENLHEQLREKDRQITEKDRQIAEKDQQIKKLIDQACNYQILLRSEQNRRLQASHSQTKPLLQTPVTSPKDFLARLVKHK